MNKLSARAFRLYLSSPIAAHVSLNNSYIFCTPLQRHLDLSDYLGKYSARAMGRKLCSQKRWLTSATISTILAGLVWLICSTTDYWIKVTYNRAQWDNSTGSFMISHRSGLWRICRARRYKNAENYGK